MKMDSSENYYFDKTEEVETSPYDDQGKTVDVDLYLEKVGQCGKFQLRIQILFIFFMFPVTYQVLIMYFAGDNPPWKCTKDSKTCNYKVIINEQNRGLYNKRCHMKRNDWEYATPKDYSIVTQFDLVCEREWLASLANAVMFIGWAVGGIALTYLSDKYGRKRILFPSVAVIIIAAAASALIKNIWFFMVCRTVIGFAQGGGSVVVFVLATEFVGPEFRSLSGTLVWFYFTAALVLMTLQAYLLKSWSKLELVCSLPFLIVLLFWKYIPESVRWLRMNNNLDKAEEILNGIAITNGREIPVEHLTAVSQSTQQANLISLFSKPRLAFVTMVQAFAWYVSGVTFYGVALASGDLGGDFYVNFVLTSLVEVPANTMVIILTNRFGRKWSVILNMILAGFACTGIAVVPQNSVIPALKFSRVLLGMTGKFGITLAFNGFYVWSAELHPTVVRAQAVGFLNVCSRIGGACSPFIVTSLKTIHPSLPFALMGGLDIIASILALNLMETKGKPTAETLEDALVAFGFQSETKKDEID